MDAVFHSQLRFHLTESGFHGRRNRRNNFRSSVVRYGAVRLKITRLLESRVSFSFFPFHVPRSFTRVLNTSTWKTSKRRRRKLRAATRLWFRQFLIRWSRDRSCVKSPLSAASCVCAVAVHCRVVTSEIRTVTRNCFYRAP